MSKDITGIHHISAITNDVKRNYEFFTEVIGMRLVKKTINQDDYSAYHTYFADHIGTPGTTMTFFSKENYRPGRHGNNSITRIGLRVPNDAALDYYRERFEEFDVKHDEIQEVFGKKVLPFEEADGQRYQLVSDENNEGMPAGEPWELSPVPAAFAVYGLGPVEITVSYFQEFIDKVTEIYKFNVIDETHGMALLEVGEGGNGAQIILRDDPDNPSSREGAGEVHHLALRVDNRVALREWEQFYEERGYNHSGYKERYYFGAIYVRIGHILFELSSDDPGFTIDEPYETLGESLALPAELAPERENIENQVKPFDTTVD